MSKDEGTAGRYRKKPVVIEAHKFPGHSPLSVDAIMEFEDWFNSRGGVGRYVGGNLHIKTLEDGPNGEAKHVAIPGDFIIRGVAGEFYPCKPHIFEATYEPSTAAPISAERDEIIEMCAKVADRHTWDEGSDGPLPVREDVRGYHASACDIAVAIRSLKREVKP